VRGQEAHCGQVHYRQKYDFKFIEIFPRGGTNKAGVSLTMSFLCMVWFCLVMVLVMVLYVSGSG